MISAGGTKKKLLAIGREQAAHAGSFGDIGNSLGPQSTGMASRDPGLGRRLDKRWPSAHRDGYRESATHLARSMSVR
jgi:hypothetical protein